MTEERTPGALQVLLDIRRALDGAMDGLPVVGEDGGLGQGARVFGPTEAAAFTFYVKRAKGGYQGFNAAILAKTIKAITDITFSEEAKTAVEWEVNMVTLLNATFDWLAGKFGCPHEHETVYCKEWGSCGKGAEKKSGCWGKYFVGLAQEGEKEEGK